MRERKQYGIYKEMERKGERQRGSIREGDLKCVEFKRTWLVGKERMYTYDNLSTGQ